MWEWPGDEASSTIAGHSRSRCLHAYMDMHVHTFEWLLRNLLSYLLDVLYTAIFVDVRPQNFLWLLSWLLYPVLLLRGRSSGRGSETKPSNARNELYRFNQSKEIEVSTGESSMQCESIKCEQLTLTTLTK